jgi:hypothetical protein
MTSNPDQNQYNGWLCSLLFQSFLKEHFSHTGAMSLQLYLKIQSTTNIKLKIRKQKIAPPVVKNKSRFALHHRSKRRNLMAARVSRNANTHVNTKNTSHHRRAAAAAADGPNVCLSSQNLKRQIHDERMIRYNNVLLCWCVRFEQKYSRPIIKFDL